MVQRNQLEHTEANVSRELAVGCPIHWNALLFTNAPCRISHKVEQAQDDTDEASSHIKRLTVKAVTSKICLIFVMLCLVVAIVLVSYYKWYPKNKKDYLGILPKTTAPAASTAGRL